MILALIWLLPAWALGVGLVRWLHVSAPAGPAYLRWAWRAFLPLVFGLGGSGLLFFVLRWLLGPPGYLLPALEIGLGALFWMLSRKRVTAEAAAETRSASWALICLRSLVALALVLNLADFAAVTRVSPHGEWDATAVWNLRAKYLASGGESWRFAVAKESGGQMMGANHPGYPLMVPGLVARGWLLAGDRDSGTPAAVSLLFSLLIVAVLAGGLAWLRSEPLACLGVLALAASEGYVSHYADQYADIPLAAFILAATVLLQLAGRQEWAPRLCAAAGFAAGVACWTKNEGIVFAALFLIAAFWAGRARALLPALLGALPGVALTGAFKILLVPAGSQAVYPSEPGLIFSRLADLSRWAAVVKEFGKVLADLGPWYAHPFILLALLVWLFQWDRLQGWRWPLLAAGPVLALLAADGGALLITNADLQWHLKTSVSRLWVQAYPALVFALLLALRNDRLPWERSSVREPRKEKPRRKKERAAV